MTTDSQQELEHMLAKSEQSGMTPSIARAIARSVATVRRDVVGTVQALQIDGVDALTAGQLAAAVTTSQLAAGATGVVGVTVAGGLLGANGLPLGNAVSAIAVSRALTASDNGQLLECTATLTLTVPEGLPLGFGCNVLPAGTTSVARSGAVLLNGAGATLTRSAASNAIFAIVGRASAVDSYVVTGA